jgi:hypothetical protein
VSSAAELGVSLLPDAVEAAAGFWKGAEPAVRVRDEESRVWAALWVCAAALSVLVPGVWVESDWPGDGAVVVSSAVWSVAVLGRSVSCEPDVFGALPGLGALVDVGDVAVAGGRVPVAGVGLAAPVGVAVTPRVEGGVGVDPAADGEGGSTEDVVAGEIPESVWVLAVGEEVMAVEVSGPTEGAAEGEEVVADETSGLSQYVVAGEEVVVDEASAPVDDATPADASTGVDAATPTAEEAGSEDGSTPAAEVESGVPAGVGASPDGGTAAAMAPGLDVSVAGAGASADGIAAPVVSAVPAAATGSPARAVAEAGAVPGVEVPDSDAGDATIPLLAEPATLVPATLLVPATPLLARAAREGCKLLPAAPLRLLLGWPSAVAVRAQCVASALWNGASGGARGRARSARTAGGRAGRQRGRRYAECDWGIHARPPVEIEAGWV